MPDAAHSTVSSLGPELANLIENGFPPVRDHSDDVLREMAHRLAMAVAYTWINEDSTSQDAFLDELADLTPESTGLMLAIDRFTAVRLFGVEPGTIRAGVDTTLRWRPPAKDIGEKEAVYEQSIEAITDLWSGVASGDYTRMTRARAVLYEMPLVQLKNVVRIMAYDTSVVMAQFRTWEHDGSGLWDSHVTHLR